MSKPFTPTPHPVLGLPTPAQMAALGREKWAELMLDRERRIAAERAEPFPHSYEPPMWKICDALLGFPWVDAAWAEAVRRHFGFEKPVKVLLINGGNRSGKSEYASDRAMRILRYLKQFRPEEHEPVRAWCLHSTLQMSRDYQQPLFYSYLPRELRGKDIKTRETYIAYKQKTGFSEEKFVLPGGNDCLFKAYEQDKKSIEGGNLHFIWCDELVPSDWVDTLELRIAEKAGWMLITFTPVEGYTETVRMFQDGATVAGESPAYLLPKDGGEPDVAAALGLTAEELAELRRAEAEQRAALCPQARPEVVFAPERPPVWTRQGDRAVVAGREFELVPRVLKCVSQSAEQPRACVFFHTSDNPYGNPKSVWGVIAGKPEDFRRERFYGIATKNVSARFPKFSVKVHVVPAASIPAEGTNYHFIDPAGRNFFQLWFRVAGQKVFVYREWPGNYVIPGVGVPGAWALPDGRQPDGKRGPAQKPFGWGHLAHKREWARLEGWKDYQPETARTEAEENPVAEWSEHNGAAETIQERFIDSRFASTPKMENDRPVTLIEEFAELGVHFTPTPGNDIEEGVQLVQDALDYDPAQPLSFFNQPKLYVAAECVNLIYALTTWTGYTRDGRRNMDGATKDPIDLLRYFFLSDCADLLGTGAEAKDADEEESEFVPKVEGYY